MSDDITIKIPGVTLSQAEQEAFKEAIDAKSLVKHLTDALDKYHSKPCEIDKSIPDPQLVRNLAYAKPRIFHIVIRTGYFGIIRAKQTILRAFGNEYICGTFEGAKAQLAYLYWERDVLRKNSTEHLI